MNHRSWKGALTLKEQQQLFRLASRIGFVIPLINIRYMITDQKGKILADDYGPGHSWVRNFYNMLFAFASNAGGDGGTTFGAGYMCSKDMAGTKNASAVRTVAPFSSTLLNSGITNGGTTNAFGIIVGSLDTAYSIEDTALATLIGAGAGGGQLVHGAMAAPTLAYTSGTKTWKATHTRVFNNNTASTITVKESGLAWTGQQFGSSTLNYLIERNVPVSPLSVLAAAQLTVTYEIELQYPG